jgi:hypothetical protein
MRDRDGDQQRQHHVEIVRQLDREDVPVNGDRIVPPRMAPMLTSGRKPAPRFGRNALSTPPSACRALSSSCAARAPSID